MADDETPINSGVRVHPEYLIEPQCHSTRFIEECLADEDFPEVAE